jgi:hypothetical protein
MKLAVDLASAFRETEGRCLGGAPMLAPNIACVDKNTNVTRSAYKMRLSSAAVRLWFDGARAQGIGAGAASPSGLSDGELVDGSTDTVSNTGVVRSTAGCETEGDSGAERRRESSEVVLLLFINQGTCLTVSLKRRLASWVS